MSNNIPGISRFPCTVLLAQHRIEAVMLDEIKKHSTIDVQHNVEPISMEINKANVRDHDSHSVTVQVRSTSRLAKNLSAGVSESATPKQICTDVDCSEADLIERIRTKYVIGCDGAHSWTREQLEFTMEGEQTEHIWGVLGVDPSTLYSEFKR